MRHPVLAALISLAAAVAIAAAPPRTGRRSPVRNELKVAPSEAIEARVQEEIRKADAVLGRMADTVPAFDSPYLISAVFYRDGFLSRYPKDKPDGDPVRRIISHIAGLLSPAKKQEFIARLHEAYGGRDRAPRPGIAQPVPYKAPLRPPRTRRTHRNAMDLFAREGTPVKSAAGGVVLLAESGWNERDPFSTSSHAGGNTVITFDPASDRFYRYCHLERADVMAGQEVEPGQVLGTVGHSGLNASRPRHGGHLHFEMNQWTGEEMRVLPAREIWQLLRPAK